MLCPRAAYWQVSSGVVQ